MNWFQNVPTLTCVPLPPLLVRCDMSPPVGTVWLGAEPISTVNKVTAIKLYTIHSKRATEDKSSFISLDELMKMHQKRHHAPIVDTKGYAQYNLFGSMQVDNTIESQCSIVNVFRWSNLEKILQMPPKSSEDVLQALKEEETGTPTKEKSINIYSTVGLDWGGSGPHPQTLGQDANNYIHDTSLLSLAPVHMVVQMGLDKMRKNYNNYLIGKEWTTNYLLSYYLNTEVDLQEQVTRMKKLHHLLEIVVICSTFLNLPHECLFPFTQSCLRYYKTSPYDEEHVFQMEIRPVMISSFYQKACEKCGSLPLVNHVTLHIR
ncbi:LOW QUALITY PROTEIN: protein zwilch homolog [Engraulis encrasicolus]|uniref:LOW QUALITY PROTEIN: protein zwilch homolog n=1 Tax=Engraulis encrasicolus TaxID=184585 RepID=UPI002FD74F57